MHCFLEQGIRPDDFIWSDIAPEGPSARTGAAVHAAKPRAADAARPAHEGDEGETFVLLVSDAPRLDADVWTFAIAVREREQYAKGR
jgi:hypothetical protein